MERVKRQKKLMRLHRLRSLEVHLTQTLKIKEINGLVQDCCFSSFVLCQLIRALCNELVTLQNDRMENGHASKVQNELSRKLVVFVATDLQPSVDFSRKQRAAKEWPRTCIWFAVSRLHE